MEELKLENTHLKEELQALQKAYVSLQQEQILKDKSSCNRHCKQFWEDIENKLKNDTEAVKKMIKDKVILMDDVNDNGWTLLQFAAYIGNYSITQLCINLGAKLNHKNDDGNTALEESQEAMMSHTEQLLLFNEMEASIGEKIKNVSFEINKQNGIISNIVNELSLIGAQSKEIFRKICVELMINIISKKLTFSDDILNLCWKFECDKYPNVRLSELYQCIVKTCRDTISGKDKRDWFWLQNMIIPSKIWYTKTEFLEPIEDDEKTMQTTVFRKTQKYLYYELLKIVKEQSELQLDELERNLGAEASANQEGWNNLVSFSVDSRELVMINEKTPRQDNIPNGIVGEYSYSQLNYDASNETFDGAKFYDHHQYLSRVTLLAQIVDDSFHKSVKKMFNVNNFTNIGIIEEQKQDIFIYYTRGPVKLLSRARSKAENDYFDQRYPTSACIIDLNRCSLVFTDINSMLFALKLFVNKVRSYQAGAVIGIVRCKNGFPKYVKKGRRYADIKLNVLIRGPSNNIVGEIQFSLKTMINFKKHAHNLYEIVREESFMAKSVSKILPSLLNNETQLKVYATMGDVYGLCGLMVFNNMKKKDLLNHDDAHDICILSPICERGKLSAFKFIISLMSTGEIIEELFEEDEFAITPIEYAMRNNHLSVIQEILAIQDVLKIYQKKEKWRYRLIFHLFSMCWNCEIIDTVLKHLEITHKEIIFLLTEFEFEDEADTDSFYAEDSIIVEMCISNNINVLKKLKSILGEEMFTQNVFVVDAKDQNALEAVCAEDKYIQIEYLLSFDQIKNEYIEMSDKDEQNKMFYRMLYLLFVRNKNKSHITFVLKQLKITKDVITNLLIYKYPAPLEEEEFDEDAYRYHEWFIDKDENIEMYLDIGKSPIVQRLKSSII